MVTFEQFFNSEIKARLIKFFIYNPENSFEAKEIGARLNLTPNSLKKHLQDLTDEGFLRSRSIKSVKSYSLETKCSYLKELRDLVLQFSAASHTKLLKNIKKIGVVKLAILGGVFLNTDKSRVDIFIVGDKIKEAQFNKFLKNLEAEVGKDLSYSTMSLSEFKYRMDMFDRFVRDVLEFPHEKIINKLKL